MLPGWWVFVAIFLRVISNITYMAGVARGTIKPNPITWFFWGLTPLVACVAQIANGSITPQTLVAFALGLGPLSVFVLSVIKTRGLGRLDRFSVVCGVMAIVGIVLWQITRDPNVAIVFSIFADMCSGLPTIRKAYNDPASERAFPYALSMTSMVITLLTTTAWTFTVYAFPVYILLINLVIVSTLHVRTGKQVFRRLIARPAG